MLKKEKPMLPVAAIIHGHHQQRAWSGKIIIILYYLPIRVIFITLLLHIYIYLLIAKLTHPISTNLT